MIKIPQAVPSLLKASLMVIAILGFSTTTASALSGSEFKAGQIIDDSVFFNNTSMSTSQIQEFLNVKVPVCDTYGTQMYNSTQTRAQYSATQGVSTPFTCLKDYRTNTTNIAPESGICNGYTGATNESAATIIYKVAQACGISPKVLLVMLQKEQSLVTDDWPWPVQYQKAMGAFCPDTAPCDSGYAGFFKQVYYGANRFKVYAANPASFNYRAGRNNTIYFHPGPCQTYTNGSCTKYYGNKYNSSGVSIPDITYCGSTSVYINNQATANLYIYTPYQPNAAALSNLYGTGDLCSAYGNRNFWRMFNDWFGSTIGPDFAAQLHSKSPYQVINSGQGKSVFLQYKNTGRAFWKDDASNFPGYRPVHIATGNPINRSSAFRANNWLTPSRTTGTISKVYESNGTTLASDQHTVQPGQIARFEFTVHANTNIAGGVYREHFQPILEGAPEYLWNMGGESFIDIGVHVPYYKAGFHSQSKYPIISPDFSSTAFLQFKNTGTELWYDNASVPQGKYPVHLATSWPINRGSKFADGWANAARPNLTFSKVYESNGTTLATNQHVVLPGQIARFEFSMKNYGNLSEGFYPEYFEPILEGAPGYSWNLGSTAWLNVGIPQTINKASYHSQSSYPTLQRGGASTAAFLQFKNTGNTKWYDNASVPQGKYPVHLATSWPINRGSKFADGWANAARPNLTFSKVYESNGTTLATNQHVVLPGQIARFEFSMKALSTQETGFYQEYFEPILEGAPGYSWNLGSTAWLGVNVQ